MFYSELKTSFPLKEFNEKNPLDFCPIFREFLEHVTLNLVWIIQWVSPEIWNVLRAYLMLFLSYLGKGTGEGVAFPSCLYVKQCSMKNKYRIYFNIFAAWKMSKCEVFSGPYFLAFELNTQKYGCGKRWTRKNSVFGHFHAVFVLFN